MVTLIIIPEVRSRIGVSVNLDKTKHKQKT